MTRRRIDGSLERQFLTALITTLGFLAPAAEAIEPSIFRSPWSQKICQWTLDYWKSFHAPPGREIEMIYTAWVEKEKPPEEEAETIRDFLSGLSEEYDRQDQPNVPHLLEQLTNYTQVRKLEDLAASITGSLALNEPQTATDAVSAFRTFRIGDRTGWNPLDPCQARSALAEALECRPESLLEFERGPMEEFFGAAFCRDALICIQAPEKRGKTFICIDLMCRALAKRSKVAFFETGDLTKNQLTMRWAVRLTSIPMWKKDIRSGVLVPESITFEREEGNQSPVAKVDTRIEHFEHPITMRDAMRATRQFARQRGLSNHLRFSVHPNSGINVAGIDGLLRRWQHEENFVPDVIIIDYADILAAENSRLEYRHQINETWKALRRLSQEWHACVIAPSQANAASYSAKTQTMGNFSEDKRKNAHVTGTLGLNQEQFEKKNGIMRLNWTLLRESGWHQDRCLYIAPCFALCQPMMVCAFADVENSRHSSS